MSSFVRRTKHPVTGKFEDASWIDDMYGNHNYGVKFPSGSVFRADEHEPWTFDDSILDKHANNVRDHGESLFFEELRDRLEDLFPKGKCKERGAALVLFAEAVILFKKHKDHDR